MPTEKEPEPGPALAKLRVNIAVLGLSDLAELRSIAVHHAPSVAYPADGPKPVFTNDQMVWWTIIRECEDQLATRLERYRTMAVAVLIEDKERAEKHG